MCPYVAWNLKLYGEADLARVLPEALRYRTAEVIFAYDVVQHLIGAEAAMPVLAVSGEPLTQDEATQFSGILAETGLLQNELTILLRTVTKLL